MEKYIINGHEVEYDTFDLENMELFDGEVRRVSASAEEMQKNATEANYLQYARTVCETIMDAFDVLIGEGTSKKVFGGRINVYAIRNAWSQFILDVRAEMKNFGRASAVAPQMNREQRRAAEREQRRAEARAKIAKRDAEIRAEMNET